MNSFQPAPLIATALLVAATTVTLVTAPRLAAQTPVTADPVLQAIWTEGMTADSQVERLAQELMDSVGPRLMGTEGYARAVDWALEQYQSFGIPARAEQYGTWTGWRRGYTRVELLAPRRRDLDAMLLAYSRGTDGPVTGPVVQLPDLPDQAAYEEWVAGVRGAFILISPPQVTCRPPENLERFGHPDTVEQLRMEQSSVQNAWTMRLQRAVRLGVLNQLNATGAIAGLLESTWSNGWGVNKIHDTLLPNVPNLDLSCEDNGLLHRLAEAGQGPVLRLDAEAEHLSPAPAVNVIAEIRGSELPNEYVLLSAHLDSWDAASGATDNGTATVMMMETMRILSEVMPNPRRTILVGHWGGEEQGLIGSGAFAEDHPEVVGNIQFGMNHDNGTWRIESIRMQGFSRAQESVDRWLRLIPSDISSGVLFTSPDSEGGSDHTSFTCRGAPVVRLQSNYPDYRQYTWHTNLDTFDKVILEDLRRNATLTAMLAYLASEEPERLSWEREPRLNANGEEMPYPACGQVRRSGGA